MKKIYLTLLLIILTLMLKNTMSLAGARSSQLDSLYKQLDLHLANNTIRLNILLAIAESQELLNPDKGIEAADKAIAIAQKLNREQELAIGYNQKARLLIMKQLADSANKALKMSIAINHKLNNQYQLAENDLTTAQFIFCQRKSDSTFRYISKSYEYFKNSGNNFILGKIYLFYGAYYSFLKTDTAGQFYQKALKCFEINEKKDWLALTNFYIATGFTSSNENDKAFEYFKITEELNKQIRSDFISENIFCTKGYLYFSLGEFNKAMNNFIPGLKIAEQINDDMMQACLLGNLGSVLGSINDYTKASEYINKQIQIAGKIGDGYTLSSGYQNLGWIEYDHENYVSALKYFNMALQVAVSIKQFDSMSECYGAVGNANEKLGNYNAAFTNLNRALELNRQQGNFYNISDNLLALSRTILNSGNNTLKDGMGGSFDVSGKRRKAIEFSLEALKIADKKNMMPVKRDALKQLSDLYGLTEDSKKAFLYYKDYISAKDSIMNSENIKSINNLQLKFETEKHEHKIALLNTDKKIKEREISKKKTERNGFIAGCAMLLLIGGVAYNRYQVKYRANKKLAEALAQLKQAQEKLIEQEKLASLGQLTAGIAHEIQNPLNFVINFSQLSSSLFDDLNASTDQVEQQEILADLEDNISKIERHGNRADGIIQSMLMFARSGETNKQATSLNSMCQEALNFSWHAMSLNSPDFKCAKEVKLHEGLPDITVVHQDIVRVIINLLNNAFYAVQEKAKAGNSDNHFEPKVKIQTAFVNNRVELKIADNGNGIPEEIRNKIFQPFFTTKPTNLGTGLGLSISYDIVKAHGGNLILESTSDQGTVFVLNLPV